MKDDFRSSTLQIAWHSSKSPHVSNANATESLPPPLCFNTYERIFVIFVNLIGSGTFGYTIGKIGVIVDALSV